MSSDGAKTDSSLPMHLKAAVATQQRATVTVTYKKKPKSVLAALKAKAASSACAPSNTTKNDIVSAKRSIANLWSDSESSTMSMRAPFGDKSNKHSGSNTGPSTQSQDSIQVKQQTRRHRIEEVSTSQKQRETKSQSPQERSSAKHPGRLIVYSDPEGQSQRALSKAHCKRRNHHRRSSVLHASGVSKRRNKFSALRQAIARAPDLSPVLEETEPEADGSRSEDIDPIHHNKQDYVKSPPAVDHSENFVAPIMKLGYDVVEPLADGGCDGDDEGDGCDAMDIAQNTDIGVDYDSSQNDGLRTVRLPKAPPPPPGCINQTDDDQSLPPPPPRMSRNYSFVPMSPTPAVLPVADQERYDVVSDSELDELQDEEMKEERPKLHIYDTIQSSDGSDKCDSLEILGSQPVDQCAETTDAGDAVSSVEDMEVPESVTEETDSPNSVAITTDPSNQVILDPGNRTTPLSSSILPNGLLSSSKSQDQITADAKEGQRYKENVEVVKNPGVRVKGTALMQVKPGNELSAREMQRDDSSEDEGSVCRPLSRMQYRAVVDDDDEDVTYAKDLSGEVEADEKHNDLLKDGHGPRRKFHVGRVFSRGFKIGKRRARTQANKKIVFSNAVPLETTESQGWMTF